MDSEGEPEQLLSDVEFDAEELVLTHRQATVLALRANEVRQRDIAELFDTSRANISNIERDARNNVEKARKTVAFAESLTAPVHIDIQSGTEIYDIPPIVYDACDEVGVEVNYGASNLLQLISQTIGSAIEDEVVRTAIRIDVSKDGTVHLRKALDE
jgi:Tfx family DNA-binding protein